MSSPVYEARIKEIQQARRERQEWIKSIDPEGFEAYWKEQDLKYKRETEDTDGLQPGVHLP